MFLTHVLSNNSMEHQREPFSRKFTRVFQRMRKHGVPTILQFIVVELFVGETQNSFVGPKVLDEFDNATYRLSG